MKNSFIAFFVMCGFGTLSFFPSAAIQAQTVSTDSARSRDHVTPEPGTPESAVLVKFLGTQDDMVLFTVSYANPKGSKFAIIIKDQDGASLYQHTFNDKSFCTHFKLPKTDKSKIAFTIRNYREADITKTFEVSVNNRLIQDVAVKKVN
jgi:hypothetical protein